MLYSRHFIYQMLYPGHINSYLRRINLHNNVILVILNYITFIFVIWIYIKFHPRHILLILYPLVPWHMIRCSRLRLTNILHVCQVWSKSEPGVSFEINHHCLLPYWYDVPMSTFLKPFQTALVCNILRAILDGFPFKCMTLGHLHKRKYIQTFVQNTDISFKKPYQTMKYEESRSPFRQMLLIFINITAKYMKTKLHGRK